MQIATSVFSNFLSDNDLDITLVVFDNESFTLSGKIFAGIDQYIDENYVEEKTGEEYGDPYNNVFMAGAAGAGLGAAALSGIMHAEEESAPVEDSEEAPDDAPDRRRRNNRRMFLGSQKSMHMESCEMHMPEPEAFAAAAAMPAATPADMPKKRSLDDVMKNISETWSESLLRMITERDMKDSEVYKRANVDRKLFSKIRSDKDYKPKKTTAVAFALALRLNVDEAKDFIGRAGYAFSPSSKFDLIIEYFIENQVYDFMTINLALFEHDQPQIG